MAKFDLKGLLNDRSVPDRQQDQKIVYRNPEDLIPSEENFYNTEKLERLKQSIKLLGILQPLLIENRDGKDYVIAGHCRRKCCIDLLNEGNDRFSRIPCIYKIQSELEQDAGQEDDIVRQIMIIQANCYRDKSDWEKMTETLKMENLVKELREKTPMEGKTRDILKDLIGTSGGQLGRYHAISTNLCEQLMSEFEEDRIKISVAYEASKLNKEYQKQACELYEETGILTLDDIKALYRQQEAEKGIPGQMSIETATGQNRPPENEVPITPELQIERFFEALNRGDKEYVLTCNVNATTYLLETRYQNVRIRNGNFNYQANSTGIMFNPGSYMECTFTWNELAHELIKRFGKKRKPVKTVSIDAPENAEDIISAVKAFCEAYPEKLKTIMRICRQCNNNGEAARAVQKRIAPHGLNGRTGPEVGYTFMGFNAGLEIEIGKEKVSMKYGRLIAEVKKLYDPWDSKFDEEGRCQSVAETPDEKQHDFVEDTKIADHPGEVTALPIMKNNDQRKEWLRNYKVWGLWYEDKNIGVKYYKYDFENGARLIAEEYAPDPVDRNSWWVSRSETYYMHLVGGPEPERKNNIPKWTYHTRYNKFPNSETELVEFLKELQK